MGTPRQLNGIWEKIRHVAASDATVLITGESGVGKEVVADEVYRHSLRNNRPYIKVNCAAIPASLLESELFGYDKGAFSGASAGGKAGLFELADGGTLLLDEIGDLPWISRPSCCAPSRTGRSPGLAVPRQGVWTSVFSP